MNSEPIIEFKTQEELNICLAEWQERLFLQGWNIKAYFAHRDAIPGLSGDCNVQWVNSCGTIRILCADEIPSDLIEKEPHEKILIHELLHFKYMGFEGEKTIENVFWDERQHQLLEQMAKSLIMAKYKITYDWFKDV